VDLGENRDSNLILNFETFLLGKLNVLLNKFVSAVSDFLDDE